MASIMKQISDVKADNVSMATDDVDPRVWQAWSEKNRQHDARVKRRLRLATIALLCLAAAVLILKYAM
jgi:hypothetical protein